MSKLTLEKFEERPVIADGETVAVEVTRAEIRETPFDDPANPGKKKWEVSFSFKITDPDPVLCLLPNDEGGVDEISVTVFDQILFGNTPTTFSTHPDCKLRLWAQEILGGTTLPVDFELDTDDLVGLPCRAVVGVRERKGGDGVGVIRKNYVTDVIHASSAPLASEVF